MISAQRGQGLTAPPRGTFAPRRPEQLPLRSRPHRGERFAYKVSARSERLLAWNACVSEPAFPRVSTDDAVAVEQASVVQIHIPIAIMLSSFCAKKFGSCAVM
ncbi:hypothetical protein Acsp04_17420 [Actinomadura sp. NBRC 104425]|nr:hypothetical protein Acsp04_17420 [Actinomadura sp. NBRC 104425]